MISVLCDPNISSGWLRSYHRMTRLFHKALLKHFAFVLFLFLRYSIGSVFVRHPVLPLISRGPLMAPVCIKWLIAALRLEAIVLFFGPNSALSLATHLPSTLHGIDMSPLTPLWARL